jgi:hypothetical protein
MFRDIVIVISLDVLVLCLAGAYLWLIDHLWTGMASIHVAFMLALLVIVCTAIAGTLVRRLYLAILGILALWTVMALYDVSTTSAEPISVVRSALFLAGVQLTLMILAWFVGSLVRKNGGEESAMLK